MTLMSIILPVWNGMGYLEQSISSVLNQSFRDFELLIVDDGSSDRSWEYLSNLKDLRIKLSRHRINKGLFPTLNALIKLSSSPLIRLWSQDDIMHPQCLERTMAFHKRYPEIGFSYSAVDTIDEEGKILPYHRVDYTPDLVSKELHARIAFFTGSIAGNIANVTLSREALDRVGPFREDMRVSGDFDMWVRVARYYPVGFIREPLINLREHAGQLSRQERNFALLLREDLQVYNYLLSYVSPQQRKEGLPLLRNHKLMYYYTLMVRAFFKGRFKTAGKFFKGLAGFDNIFLLTAYFIRNKLFQKKKLHSHHIDNAAIVVASS